MNERRANESSSIQVSQPTFKLTCIFVLIVSKLYIIMIAMGQMKILFSGGYSLYVDFIPYYCHRGTGAYDEKLIR